MSGPATALDLLRYCDLLARLGCPADAKRGEIHRLLTNAGYVLTSHDARRITRAWSEY